MGASTVETEDTVEAFNMVTEHAKKYGIGPADPAVLTTASKWQSMVS